MGNEFKILHLPLRLSLGEARLKLVPPFLYRVKAHILKKIHLTINQSSYYTVQNLPKYELAGWPLFVVSHTVSNIDGSSSRAYISVDPWSKVTNIFERMHDTLETPASRYNITFNIPEDIETDEILITAKNRLIFQIMRMRKFKISSLEIESKLESIVYLPVWVCYYARTSRSLDVCLLDGYSGEKLGAQFRSAFLNALTSRLSQK